jgi:hypothetical protein
MDYASLAAANLPLQRLVGLKTASSFFWTYRFGTDSFMYFGANLNTVENSGKPAMETGLIGPANSLQMLYPTFEQSGSVGYTWPMERAISAETQVLQTSITPFVNSVRKGSLVFDEKGTLAVVESVNEAGMAYLRTLTTSTPYGLAKYSGVLASTIDGMTDCPGSSLTMRLGDKTIGCYVYDTEGQLGVIEGYAGIDFVTRTLITKSAPASMKPNYDAQETTNRISTNNGTWTADRNGFVNIWVEAYANNSAFCSIKGKTVAQGYSSTSTSVCRGVYAVEVGDVVRFWTDGSSLVNAQCFFIPPRWIAAPTVAKTPLLGAQYQAFQENNHGASATTFYPANGTIAPEGSKNGDWVTVDRYCMMKIARISTGPVQGFFKVIQLERDGAIHDLAANQNMTSELSWSDIGGWTHVLRPGDKIRCRLTNHGAASATYTKSQSWSYVGLCNIIWENIPV